ncbi:MAG TPA: serine/threonine-protein kinase, partial [Herpetosiphonaceae bacterium]
MEIAQHRIGRYEILGELGRGGSGIVYRAFEPLLERRVALKILAPAAAAQPGVADRLRREAISAARLRHLNIALLYEFGEADGHSFLAMEYIPGRTLRAALAEGGMAPARALFILGQIGRALDYMHEVGVVHRDVKPGNIIIGPGDHAVLIDFGLAYADEAATAESAMIGTPTYLSPEQAAGAPSGPASDQYALAVVAYELLAGSPP